MAYGACRRVCAANLRVLEQLQRLADERKAALNFVVFGLDPSQDRPADWAAYRAERKLTALNAPPKPVKKPLAPRCSAHASRPAITPCSLPMA